MRTFLALLGAGLLCAATQGLAEESYKPAVKVTPLLKTETTTSGAAIHYPEIGDPEVQTLVVEIPPGGETGWHLHPFPIYAYILAGAIEVETTGGVKKTFKAGDAFAEMVGQPHNGHVVGNESVRILMVVTGEEGKPFTERVAAPKDASP